MAESEHPANDLIAAAPPRGPHAMGALAMAAVLDALLVGGLAAAEGNSRPWALAAAVHLGAVALVWTGTRAEASGRVLAAALALTLPLVGPCIAALALGTRGRGEIARFVVDDQAARRAARKVTFTAEDARRLGEGLSACETLLSGSVDERRAILAMLVRRADAHAVSILRWAAAGHDADLAVEAALSLEELGAALESELASCRAAMDARPGFESALAAADAIAEALRSGLADASLVPALAAEARRCYRLAEEFDAPRLRTATAERAWLSKSAEHRTGDGHHLLERAVAG